MLKRIKYLFMCLGLFLLCISMVSKEKSTSTKYKCMVQLVNYTGEGAYIIVSLLNENGEYMKTLQVLGDDEEWYPDLRQWWVYYREDKVNIDGITGATIGGGERSVFVIEIEDELLDAGNQLRFETAVEDQKYHTQDLQIPLTTNNTKGKFEGNGYIRYVRMVPNK